MTGSKNFGLVLAALVATLAPCFVLQGGIADDFLSPPVHSRPWCYWYWVNGNVDRASVTADLEAVKRVGFGGVLLLDPRGYDKVVEKPAPLMPFGGDEWRRIVVFAMRECERLGLEFTMNLSDCGGSLKGPWLTGKDAPKRLVCGVDVDEPSSEFRHYRDIAEFEVFVSSDCEVKPGWRNAGGVVDRWQRDVSSGVVKTVKSDSPGVRRIRLRFGYCLIPDRGHDVDVIDPGAVERHFDRITGPLMAEAGDLVGRVWTHVYSVSWEGAIPTWTEGFEKTFRLRAGYDILSYLPCLAGFVPAEEERRLQSVLKDYRRVRNGMFKDNFYGTIRRLAHEKGLKLYSESGGPWNRDPSVFKEADQLAFLGMNDMPQGEFWVSRYGLQTGIEHNRPAANAARIYGLKRASAESFSHTDLHYSVYPAVLKKHADTAFVDGINHFVWHTFTCSPAKFGKPGLEYFAGSHLNPNVTWFEEAGCFIGYIARCQVLLQAGSPVTDIAVYGGAEAYRHWGRYRRVPWEGARIAIPPGYCYDVLNNETLHRKRSYPVFIDGTGDTVVWPKLPRPDLEGDFDDFIHRRTEDGTDIYFIISPKMTAVGQAVFRVRDKVAEIWDPVTGTRRTLSDAVATSDGRTRLKLEFQRDGSVFVVFRPKRIAAAEPAPVDDWTSLRPPIAVFKDGWKIEIGGKTYDHLGDWTKSADSDIRYFSGRAVYRNTFSLSDVPASDRALYLGRVAGGLARVLVNGRDCGVAWCYPFRVKVPAALLKKGRNDLEIQVVNTWKNRLIGECLLPESERKTRTCFELSEGPRNDILMEIGRVWWAKGYCAEDALDVCGLCGPVELR